MYVVSICMVQVALLVFQKVPLFRTFLPIQYSLCPKIQRQQVYSWLSSPNSWCIQNFNFQDHLTVRQTKTTNSWEQTVMLVNMSQQLVSIQSSNQETRNVLHTPIVGVKIQDVSRIHGLSHQQQEARNYFHISVSTFAVQLLFLS